MSRQVATPPVDRTRPPAPGPVERYAFPDFSRRRLPVGLEVIPVPVARTPLVSVAAIFPAGGWFDPEDRAGMATLVSGLLDEGTEHRDALEIAAAVEHLGGRLETAADWNVAAAEVRLLDEHLEDGLEILADVILRPTFPPDEVERARRNRLTDLLRRRDQPAVVASDHFYRLLYGETPYGRPLVGRPEDVRSVDRAGIEAFYRRNYSLQNGWLVGVGSLDADRFEAAAARAFGAGAPGEPVSPPVIRPPAPGGVRVRVVDRPGAAQTELRMGHAGVARTHPDWTPLTVMNVLLGGKFTSRINLNLRERHGLTYSAGSRFVPRQGPGPFVINAAVATPGAGTAAREVLGELERLQAELVGEEELRDTKSYVLGVFPYTLQTVDGILAHMENLAVYGLPDDHYAPERYLERLQAVTREEVLRVAREHLQPHRATIVAVGPAAELAPQFQGLGEVEVVRDPAQ
ncbi:MAG: M16 family metallopeptidase [Thermoanaerobaculia bacterium]